MTVSLEESKKIERTGKLKFLQTSVDVILNVPTSQRNLDTFPPSKYPLVLNITFNRKAEFFKNQLKETLNQIPKNQLKYRQVGKCVYSFNCYFNAVNLVEPILDVILEESKMYRRFLLVPDEEIDTYQVVEKCNAILNLTY